MYICINIYLAIFHFKVFCVCIFIFYFKFALFLNCASSTLPPSIHIFGNFYSSVNSCEFWICVWTFAFAFAFELFFQFVSDLLRSWIALHLPSLPSMHISGIFQLSINSCVFWICVCNSGLFFKIGFVSNLLRSWIALYLPSLPSACPAFLSIQSWLY